ncbi:MAG: site-2 protease family protein [Clostridiales bacterium]|nr:site-2 protease family protein [Clostridiales bacterium]
MLFSILTNENYTRLEAIAVFFTGMFIFVASLMVRRLAQAGSAYIMGDKTPKETGTFTLNPFKHLDPVGFVCFLLFGIGWSKHVPINPMNFKKYRAGTRLVSFSGMLSNFLLGLASAITYFICKDFLPETSFLFIVLDYIMIINGFLVMFNIIPIFPFDGFTFITSFMRSDNKFIHYSVKNSMKILFTTLIVVLIIEIFTGFNLLDWFLSLVYGYIYLPIALI